MVERPALLPEARRILDLALRDREAATRAVGELPLDEQVALVCGAPLARRAELIGLLPAPELLVPRIPEAELCFTVKTIGITDAAWLLEHATPEQAVACVDLDAWCGDSPDRAALGVWVEALVETGTESLLRSVRALDPELVVLFLKSRIAVVQKPSDDEGWQPPEGAQTLDGQFHFAALREDDDLAGIVQLLRTLFEGDYWMYFRTMQGVIWELDSENEEWALRWRSGRLEDLGFPPWEAAMRIYRYIRPDERAAISEGLSPLNVSEWHLPVWIPQLPAGPDARHQIFRTIARMTEDERRAAFHAFIAVSNKVAVADRMTLSDAESTPRAIDKAARLASRGLEFVARENSLDDTEVLRRVSIERLFRVGANLDLEGAKP